MAPSNSLDEQAEAAWQDHLAEQAWEQHVANKTAASLAQEKPYQPQFGQASQPGYADIDNLGKGLKEAVPNLLSNAVPAIGGFLNPNEEIAKGGMLAGLQGTPLSGLIGPLSSIRDAGVEATADMGGRLAATGAGGLAGAKFGAAGGALFGPAAPVTVPIGATLGSLLGGTAGFVGYDMTKDAAGVAVGNQEEMRPMHEYANEAAYDLGQGVLGEGLGLGLGYAAKGLARTSDAVTQPITEVGANRNVAKLLEDVDPNYRANIDEALINKADDPFLSHKSLGEVLDNPELMAQERTAVAAGNEGSEARFVNRKDARIDARLRYLDDLEPSKNPYGEVSEISMENTQARLQSDVDLKLQQLEDQARVAAEPIIEETASYPLRDGELSELGDVVREGAEDIKSGYRDESSSRFQGLSTEIVDHTPIRDTIEQVTPEYFAKAGITEANDKLVKVIEKLNAREPLGIPVKGIRGNLREGPLVKYSLKDLQGIRRDLVDATKDAGVGLEKRLAVGVSNKIKKAIDDSIEAAVDSGKLPLRDLEDYIEARTVHSKADDIFGSKTPTQKVLKRIPYGNYEVAPSQVISKYWQRESIAGSKGGKEAIRNFKDAIGSSPRRLEPLHRYATDSYFKEVVKPDKLKKLGVAGGSIDLKAHRKWLQQHSGQLSELPELRARLSNAKSAQEFLEEKLGDLSKTQAEFDEAGITAALGVNSTEIIPQLMKSGKDTFKKTSNLVGWLKKNSPEDIKGLRRGIIDHMKRKVYKNGGDVPYDSAIKYPNLQYDGKALKGVFEKEWEVIKEVHDALPANRKIFTETQVKGFDALYADEFSQAKAAGSSVPGSRTAPLISNMEKLVKKGETFVAKAPILGPWLQSALEKLSKIPHDKFISRLEEVLYNDPRLAKELTSKYTPSGLTEIVSKVFKDELITAGVLTTTAVNSGERSNARKKLPKQQEVISSKSFPTADELLSPAEGSISKKKSERPVNISDDGIGIIKEAEGQRLEAYKDSAGIPTIGYGHTGNAVGEGRITEERATQLLRKDMEHAEDIVRQKVTQELTQNQFDALVSFVFNVGEGNFGESTLLRKLNEGNLEEVPAEFNKWVNGGGQQLPGLVIRRKREAELFASSDISGGQA